MIWKDFDYIKSQVVVALNEWLEMMKEEDRDFSAEFYQYVWSVLEDDDFYWSDKEGNRIED